MFTDVLFFFLSCILVVLSLSFVHREEWGYAMISTVFALGVFGILAFVTGPRDFGWGYVPWAAEKFTERLSEGVVYRLFSSVKDDNSQVLLVKKVGIGRSEFYAIRVEGNVRLSEYFTLIDGQPIAIAAPAVPANAK